MIKILSLKSTQNQTMPLSVILKRVEVGGDNFLSDVKHDFQKNINVAYEIDHRFSSPGVPGVSTPFLADQVPCFENKKVEEIDTRCIGVHKVEGWGQKCAIKW